MNTLFDVAISTVSGFVPKMSNNTVEKFQQTVKTWSYAKTEDKFSAPLPNFTARL